MKYTFPDGSNFLDVTRLKGRDADYTTNAQSYFDKLAKDKNLIKELAFKIWQYDETLKASLEEIEDVLTHYSDILDGKIENFDKTILDLTQKWLDENMEDIMTQATKMVWFGLNDEGYFIAVVPKSWDHISFDTSVDGELILKY